MGKQRRGVHLRTMHRSGLKRTIPISLIRGSGLFLSNAQFVDLRCACLAPISNLKKALNEKNIFTSSTSRAADYGKWGIPRSVTLRAAHGAKKKAPERAPPISIQRNYYGTTMNGSMISSTFSTDSGSSKASLAGSSPIFWPLMSMIWIVPCKVFSSPS